MADTYRMSEDTDAKLREAADRGSEKVHEMGAESIRMAADKINRSAKEGLRTVKQFADAAQQYVQDSGLADIDLREIVERDPWIALGAAFAVGFLAAQLMRRLSPK